MPPEALKDFKVVSVQPVRWGDMDAFGHVNNVVFLQYFESARIAYFEAVGFTGAGGGVGPILHSTSCRFRLPLRYPDTVHVGCRVTELQPDRFKHEYRIWSAALNAVAAEGEGLIVAYDYGRQAKAQLPEPVLAKIRELDAPRQG